MASYAINPGHSPNCRGMSCKALGFDEVDEDRKVADSVARHLRAAGQKVTEVISKESTSRADLHYITQKANASGAERFVSIHFNAFDGKAEGVEVLYNPNSKTGWSKETAKKLSAALAKLLGIKDRGAKARTNLWVLNQTVMPAVLIETLFGDHAGDVGRYRKVGPEAIGKCIAEVLVGKSVAAAKPAAKPTPAPAKPAQKQRFGGLYRCAVAKLNVRDRPSMGGKVVASYSKGQTVRLEDAYTVADGYVWGQYVGATSGKKRYVAVGKATGRPDPSDYLIRV